MTQSGSPVTVTFTLTEQDLLRLTWTVHYRRMTAAKISCWIICSILVFVFLSIIGFSAWHSGDPAYFVLALVPPLLSVPIMVFVVVPIATRWRVRTAYWNDPAARRETTYVVSDDGIQASNDFVRSDVKWGAVVEVIETKRDFLLFVSNQAAFMMPKDALPTPEERQRLRRIIKDNAGDRVSLLHGSGADR